MLSCVPAHYSRHIKECPSRCSTIKSHVALNNISAFSFSKHITPPNSNIKTALPRLRAYDGASHRHLRGYSTLGMRFNSRVINNQNNHSAAPRLNNIITYNSHSRPITSIRSVTKKSTNTTPTLEHSTSSAIKDYRDCKYPPRDELTNFQLLVEQLCNTTSIKTKKAILAKHPEHALLLSWIYDPVRQYHVTSEGVKKHAMARAKLLDDATADPGAERPGFGLLLNPAELSRKKLEELDAICSSQGLKFDHLSDLLHALSTRSIVGKNALDSILIFIARYCDSNSKHFEIGVDSYATILKHQMNSPLSKLFFRILDKNLRAGCSAVIINDVFPSLIKEFHVSLAQSLKGLGYTKKLFGNAQTTKNTKKENLEGDTSNVWYASRKLDGVRCLTRISRITEDIETLSRNGRRFDNLTVIRDAIRQILSSPSQGIDNNKSQTTKSSNRKNWEMFFRQALGVGPSTPAKNLPEEIYLDGEVCVFTESKLEASKEKNRNLAALDDGDVKDVEVVGGDSREDMLGHEVFLRAFSIARRGSGQDIDQIGDDSSSYIKSDLTEESTLAANDTPVYCIFDCITDKEFADRTGSRLFKVRIQGIADALSSRTAGQPQQNPSIIRTLRHIRVENAAHLEKMIDVSLKLNWEGIMLRNNCGYEGKRSRNMLKVKRFLDAEYVVQDAMVGSMRVPVDGGFKECDGVLTNVVIEHRGNKVRVGSGFSMDERVMYGKDPSRIIGQTISVQYFEESSPKIAATNSNKDKDEETPDHKKTEWSLRFPTVKAIYGKGPRQI